MIFLIALCLGVGIGTIGLMVSDARKARSKRTRPQ